MSDDSLNAACIERQMHSDSEKNMSAYADQNHAPILICIQIDFSDVF